MNTDKKHLHSDDEDEENDLGQFPLGAIGDDEEDITDDDILPLDDEDIEDELDPLLAEEDGEEDEGDLY